jgi:hypothetical protein
MKLFLDDFNVFSHLETHTTNCSYVLTNAKNSIILILTLKNASFGVFKGDFKYIVSKEGKSLDPKNFFVIVNMPPLKTLKDIQVFNNMA